MMSRSLSGAFDDAVTGNANEHVDETTNSVIRTITDFAGMSSLLKNRAMQVLGRLYGETLSHEIIHSLIGRTLSSTTQIIGGITVNTGGHNAHPGIDHDIMNFGIDRSFEDRTGFVLDRTQIAGGNLNEMILEDKGIAFINIPTGTAQANLDEFFPVPPAFT